MISERSAVVAAAGSRAEAVRVGLCTLLVLLGTIVVIGWLSGAAALKSIVPGLSTMKFNTACGFLLAGTAFAAAPRRGWSGVATAAGALLAALGLATLAEYALGVSLGIDQLVVPDRGVLTGSGFPGRMSPLTCTAYVALGAAAILLARARDRRWLMLAHLLVAYAGLMGFLSAAGYTFGAEAFWHFGSYTYIAVHTAAGLLVATAAGLMTRARDGWLERFADAPSARSLLARILPAAIAVPPALGLLVLLGAGVGAYNAPFAFALFVPVVTAAMVGISLWIATRVREGERALAESEARFRTIADVAPAPIWVTGKDGIEFANRAYFEIARRDPAEVMGHGWMQLMHPDDLPTILAMRDHAWDTSGAYRYQARFRRGDGDWRWIDAACTPRFDGKGRLEGYVGMAVDITEQRRAEEELRRSEALLRAMFDNAGVGIVLMDRACTILEANAAFAGLTGRPMSDIQGACCLDFTHPEDRPSNEALLAALDADGAATALEKRYVRPDGSFVRVRITPSLVGGRLLQIVEDVTERHAAEQQLRLMVDELNHRVKNTLAIVQGLAQQSFKGEEVAAEAKASFEGRLAALAGAHSILTRAKWEAAAFGDLAREVLGPIAPERLVLDGPDVQLQPKAAVSLAMALHELSTNALKYGALSDGTGRVRLSWSLANGTPERRLLVAWREEGGPLVTPPARRGFGTRMIERALSGEPGGQVRLDFAPEGVVCELECGLG